MKKIFYHLLSTVVFLILVVPTFAAPAPLPQKDNDANSITELVNVFENLLAAVMVLAGFASFVMIIVSGFRFVTSQGDPKALQGARSSLFWAAAGVGVIILGWLIISLIAEFTGVDVTLFKLTTGL